MDFGYDFGVGEVEAFVVSLQFLRNGGKTLVPVILLPEAVALDHGTHRPVHHEDFFSVEFTIAVHSSYHKDK